MENRLQGMGNFPNAIPHGKKECPTGWGGSRLN